MPALHEVRQRLACGSTQQEGLVARHIALERRQGDVGDVRMQHGSARGQTYRHGCSVIAEPVGCKIEKLRIYGATSAEV